MNTIHTHTRGGEEEEGEEKKTEIRLRVVGENDVSIITFRNEVWDECIHAPYHPWRGTQAANATAPGGQSILRPA